MAKKQKVIGRVGELATAVHEHALTSILPPKVAIKKYKRLRYYSVLGWRESCRGDAFRVRNSQFEGENTRLLYTFAAGV